MNGDDSNLTMGSRFYHNLFDVLDANDTNTLDAKQAFGLFKTSDLDDAMLQSIWNHIKIFNQKEIRYDGFIKGIKLISMAQIGCKFPSKLSPVFQYIYVPYKSKPILNQLIAKNLPVSTVEHLKQNITNKYNVPIDELYVAAVKNHKIQQILNDQEFMSDFSEGIELFVYHSPLPEEEKKEPFKIHHKHNKKYIGIPLIISYPVKDDVPGSYLWQRLLESMQPFMVTNDNQKLPFTFGSHWDNDQSSPELQNSDARSYLMTADKSIHFSVYWSDISGHDDSYNIDEEKQDDVFELDIFDKDQKIPSPILKYPNNFKIYEDEKKLLEIDKNIINQIMAASNQDNQTNDVKPIAVESVDALFTKHNNILSQWNETTNKLDAMHNYTPNEDETKETLYEKYESFCPIIEKQQHRMQQLSTNQYVIQLMKQQEILYQSMILAEAVLANKQLEIEKLNKQSNVLQNDGMEIYKSLQNMKQEYNNAIYKKNVFKLQLNNKQFMLNEDNEHLQHLKLSSKRCVALMEEYHKFTDVNSKHIQILSDHFKDEWAKYEQNWSKWNVQSIIEWFRYKTKRLDLKECNFENIAQEMTKQNISGLTLQHIDINTLYLFGINDFQIRSDIFKSIKLIIRKYPMDNQKNDDEKEKTFASIPTPQKFKCPITKLIMIEPVIAFDGNTYEKSAIEQYLKLNKKSPITNQAACTMLLYPNVGIKQEIEFYQSAIKTSKSDNEGYETYYID